MDELEIETSVPEWLIKLESRREKIKAKLGHESGNGAPCMSCGSKCPGLDLHFWRKVCRNCKCRKEQHDCKDDLISGWAQFEILGAIRSKPAYIKISELADKLVQLDWIPPNVTAELASDYMSKIGEQNIPIVGSNAAKKRRQQLEYQVPPHDLDAALCHNLSEKEATQLVHYVEKIKKNCVGQGIVVRIGDKQERSLTVANHPQLLDLEQSLPGRSPTGKLLNYILCSEPVRKALLEDPQNAGQQICILSEPLEPDFNTSLYLSDKIKYKLKLMKVNSEAIRTAVEQASEIDNVIKALKLQRVSFENSCNIMGPLYQFRKEYERNPKFQAEINKYLNISTKPESSFKYSAQSKQQENASKNTKVPNTYTRQCLAAMKKDNVLASILDSEALKTILQKPTNGCKLIISRKPLIPDFQSSSLLPAASKTFLESIKLNSEVVKSAVINGPLYDELFSKLQRSGINYAEDSVLRSLDMFREKFISYEGVNCFQKDIINFVKGSDLSSFGVTAAEVPDTVQATKTAQCEDPILSSLLANPDLQDALNHGKQLSMPLHLSSNIPKTDKLLCTSKISRPTYEKIANTGIDHLILESVVINGPIYDTLLQRLNNRGINFAGDLLLDSIMMIRNEYRNDDSFRKDLARYIAHPEPHLFEQIEFEHNPTVESSIADQMSKMHIAHSDDSKFESVPPTPNYSTYPGPIKQTESQTEPNLNDEFRSRSAILENRNSSNQGSLSWSHATCSGCLKAITLGEVVVKAERVGSNAAWHPQCFKCYKCNELLADLVYFFHDGQVYCGRDLANILKIPRCAACDELIFTKEYTAAEGATFHIRHFCCYHCDAPLAGQQYVPDVNSSMPLCLNCYDTYFAKTCYFCHATIGPTEQGVAWNNIHWHGMCFLCNGKGCGKSLIGGRFCIKKDMPFCSAQCVKSVQL